MSQSVSQSDQARLAGGDRSFTRLMVLRRLVRALLVVDKIGWLVAGFIAGGLMMGVADYLVRLPWWIRAGGLVVAAAGAAWVWWRHVRPAARFKPTLEELALRVERTEVGRTTGMAGVLASGVGLAHSDHPGATLVAGRAAQLAQSTRLLGLVRWKPAAAAMGASVFAGLALAAMLAASPVMTLIGARRVVTPWTDTQWPKRTGVRDLTGVNVHPLGAALPLRAALVKGDAQSTRVYVRYSAWGGPERELALVNQGRFVALPVEPIGGADSGAPTNGALFEAVLDAGSLAGTSGAGQGGAVGLNSAEGELVYRLVSADDQSEPVRVRLVAPPAVVGAVIRITDPTYARASAPSTGPEGVRVGAAAFEPRVLDAGPGTDQRATVVGVLPGSAVEVTLRFNKPLPLPSLPLSDAASRGAWARLWLGDEAAAALDGPGANAAASEQSWTLAWTHVRSVRLAPRLRDADGVEAATDAVYRVEVREDRPPEALVVLPGSDVEALPTAKVQVTGEARDDVGVRSVELRYAVAQPTGGSAGGLEVVGDPKVSAGHAAEPGVLERAVQVRSELDLATLGVGPGAEVWLTVMATDVYEVDGVRHEPVVSAVRRVRVISAETMAEQVWNELGGVRRSAVRGVEDQERLTEQLRKSPSGVPRKQSQQTEAIGRMGQAVSRLSAKVRENGLEDAELSGMLARAAARLEEARDASAKAAERAAEADETARAGDTARAASQQAAAATEQERSSRALEQLAGELDQGQDAWSTTRSVQRLLEDQQAVRRQTAELGDRTVGKTASELTSAERAAAEELAQRQEQLAGKAAEQVRKLRQRAEQMQATDPAGAQAMRDAAQRGERAGVTERMNQAAEQVRQNRQAQAGEQQAQAEAGISQMLEQLKQNQASRDATLRRQMASLIEAINRLIAMQEQELGRLSGALVGAGGLDGLDGAMVRVHTGTLAATVQAREAGREGRSAAALLGQAADAQQGAVTDLRESPPKGGDAEIKERQSMELLTKARDEARDQAEQAAKREADRRRAELKSAYEGLLKEQGMIRSEGADLIGRELTRALRVRARALAERQSSLADKARAVLADSEDLKDADVFALAHQRLDSYARSAADGLLADAIERAVEVRQRSAERVLAQIIDALSEGPAEPDEFREAAGDEEGGSGSGPGGTPPAVPPAAEVKLLRLMQQEALALTRSAAEGADGATAQEAAALQKQLLERASTLVKKLQSQGGGK